MRRYRCQEFVAFQVLLSRMTQVALVDLWHFLNFIHSLSIISILADSVQLSQMSYNYHFMVINQTDIYIHYQGATGGSANPEHMTLTWGWAKAVPEHQAAGEEN